MMAALAKSYRFNQFVVDARSACLRRSDAPVPLRPQSFDVLLHLVRNRGRLVSKDELFEQVWADVVVTDNSLVQCIKEIRHALGDDLQTTIQTVAKRGYVSRPRSSRSTTARRLPQSRRWVRRLRRHTASAT
jgi:DNA-binding winged helix-turn-helix (wHTH) protein